MRSALSNIDPRRLVKLSRGDAGGARDGQDEQKRAFGGQTRYQEQRSRLEMLNAPAERPRRTLATITMDYCMPPGREQALQRRGSVGSPVLLASRLVSGRSTPTPDAVAHDARSLSGAPVALFQCSGGGDRAHA